MTTVGLALALALFAMMPSSAQQSSAQSARSETPPPAKFEWQALGAQVFEANCSSCHQKDGQGIASAFPPLGGHVAKIIAQPMGRKYLQRLVLFGLEGEIRVKRDLYDGVMPPWPQLDDIELAATLNYILHAWGNDKLLPLDFEPIQPSEVTAAREEKMTAAEVLVLREKVVPAMSAGVSGASLTSIPPTFTAEQAERGKTSYAQNCGDCHGMALDDGEYCPPLKGAFFRQSWGNGSVAALYGKTKSTMPVDRPGELSEQTYVDVIAFLLSQNGYTAGDKELPVDPKLQERMSLKEKK
jgi:mono/diheme cytochrome c family protein